MKSLLATDLPRTLVVSIHDVTPATMPRVEMILAELDKLRIRRTSLLVIPNYHERLPILEHPHFIEKMKALAVKGHDVVLHGYFHKRKRRRGESFLKRLMTRVYTSNEGEFYDISEERAMEKILQGLSDLRSCGLNPNGFVAPAWLLSAGGESAARTLGLQFTNRLGSTLDLQQGTLIKSQSLVWSVRSPLRVATSIKWNRNLEARLKPNPLMRMSIHPVDFDHDAVAAQILRIAGRAAKERTAMTYDQWNQCIRDTTVALTT